MPRKPHSADAANAAIIATAVRFELALFLGVGRFAKASATTLADARCAALHLEAGHPNGKRTLIYGIDTKGRSALVTDDYSPPKKELAMKTYSKKFNAQRAARTELGDDAIEGIDFRTVVTKDGYVWQRKLQPKGSIAGVTKQAAEMPVAAHSGKRATIEEAARQGVLPEPPDSRAETHGRYRANLARFVEMAKAGDIEGLKSMEVNPVSTSPRAMLRYRDLCIVAIEAQRRAA
jgi:hypothetical protein